MYVNGGSMHILSFGKSAIFCCRDRLLNCLHLTHLSIIDRSNELQLMIKKTEDLIWLIVRLGQHLRLCHDTIVLSIY